MRLPKRLLQTYDLLFIWLVGARLPGRGTEGAHYTGGQPHAAATWAVLPFDAAPLIRYNARQSKSGMDATFFPLLYVQLEGASCVADEASHPCISRWNGISRHFHRGGGQQRRRGGFQHFHHRLPGNSTDPSYGKQIVTLTYPHIGNVGCQPRKTSNRARYLPPALSFATCP